MFDIGFSEIVLLAVVALVVLGPEKMPGAVRTAALMIGRLKRTFSALKTEIEKEIGADEIRRQLRNEEIMERFKQTQSQIQNTIDSVSTSADDILRSSDAESAAVSSLGSTDTAAADAATSSETPAAAAEPAAVPETHDKPAAPAQQ